MYQKYHTEALVLGSFESGEADRVVTLFTREFGMVRARAGAVRLEKSKMRAALQHHSLSNVSLVRGKRGWRVAGATALRLAKAGPALAAWARIAELTVRLVGTEERNEYLFDALAEAHRSIMHHPADSTAAIEIVCVARVLFALGYLSDEALKTQLFTHTAYRDEHLQEAEVLKEMMLKSINSAIAETHL